MDIKLRYKLIYQTVCLHGISFGLPDASIRESKERVRTAIKNSGYEIPSRKIVINLSPANIKKEGAIFDLSISIGILRNLGIVRKENLKDFVFIGELSLDGKIKACFGILPMCIASKKLGIKTIIVPKENSKEAAVVDGIDVIGVENLKEVVDILNGELKVDKEKIDIDELFKMNNKNTMDFSEVKGKENVKRALEIAAAGGHNCLLIGSPGSRENNVIKKNDYNITRIKL